MKIINLEATPKTRMNMEGAENVQKQVPISAQDGSPVYAFRVFTIDPKGHTPYHTHAFEHLNYIIEGEGAVVMATGEERPVKKGDFVLILPGENALIRLMSQISLLHHLIGAQLGCIPAQHDGPGLHHIAPVSHSQGRAGVLFHQQDGSAAPMHLLDRIEDAVYQDRR